MRHIYRFGLLALLVVAPSSAVTAEANPSAKTLFLNKVQPILARHCYRCHSSEKRSPRGGLVLDSSAGLRRGGDSGPIIVPGKPENSLLLRALEYKDDSLRMPPKGKLPQAVRADIARWIALGAPIPDTARPPDPRKPALTHWAYLPATTPAIPRVSATERVRTPIDAFLLARLEGRGLPFNPDAPRGVLLRRVCFDLLGLPPSLQLQKEFLSDTRPDAYERLVDRLLASPRYGERWGRHWLDLAGYADSDGYLAADRLRPEAWRYRDYVIQALNSDLPYDQFVTEQLAGDEMSDWRRAKTLTPEMRRQLTATGFLRTALDPTYPGYTEPNEIHQVLSDTMQIVGSTFLGRTIHCARCHRHKFDPISLRDYYALQTIFLPALDPARWQPSSVRGIPLATERERARMQQHNQKVAQRVQALNAQLTRLTIEYRKKASGDAKKPVALSPAQLAKRFPGYKTEMTRLKAAIKAENARRQKPILLRGLMDLEGKVPQGRVLLRGDYRKPGKIVAPNVPEALTPAGYKLPIRSGYKTTGRRLAFARWLAGPARHLTARVQVNRMWAHHFGRGIVSTVANLGRSGARPTHPKLLDWLANEFMRTGWSRKALHRQIVLSTAYRQDSRRDSLRQARDPDNKLLSSWRPGRHEGEVLRDSILAVTGKLNNQAYGPPAPVTARGDGSVETSDTLQGNRRSIYLIVRRSQHLTLLDLFDTPMMEVNCPKRTTSTVPLQALALMHGPFTNRNARNLAQRIMNNGQTTTGRIAFAFRLLYTRDPRPREVTRIRKFLDLMQEESKPEEAWAQLALALFNSNEFLYVP